MTAGRLALALALLIGSALAAPGTLAAQDPPPDTVQVDSTRIRIQNQLRLLAKPPGVDSTLARDTLQAQRQRQQQRRAQTAPPTDSIMAALMELGGYTVTRYGGAGATFNTGTERLVLTGAEGDPARLSQPGQSLTARDTITYDDPRGLVWTAGPTTTERPGEEPVESESIVYSLTADRGSARQARTSFQQGGTWIMQGDLPSIVPDTVYGHHIIFTSCQETEPHYHFAAREAKIVGGSWLVVRNVTLNFADVPVMWLPFIFQNTEQGRSSGILTPRFSINDVIRTSRGAQRRVSNVGFFWAINNYMDATVALDWWSENFTSLTGSFRYNVASQFLNGQFNYRQFWRANGGRELGFDTRHSWEFSERMSFDASARYITDAGFVRQNSFDPREVTGSIDSQGGLNRRFDWGSLSVNGNRRQYLNDDRVEMTLPQLNLSLSPITLFSAPQSRAGFFNNMTWSGSANASRRTVDRVDQAIDEFSLGQADRLTTSAGVSSSLNAGALRWSQSLRYSQDQILDVPSQALDSVFVGDGRQDVNSAQLTWNMALDYQQRLIGTTTFTPNLRLDGRLIRDDQIEEAQEFVSAPSRFSFGATLKSDIYGLFGGLGPFEAIRHKMSPSVNWQYAPEVVPTDLQEAVFGSQELKARNVLTLNFNQTFEAKRRPREESVDTLAADAGEAAGATGQAADPERPAPPGGPPADREEPTDPNAPRRVETGEIVNLLSLQTSAVTYDFVRASDDGNELLDGFTTTRLRNQISSDFLRGLAVSVEHDLFGTDDSGKRTFDPQLTQMNLSFQISNNSGLVRGIAGLLGVGGDGPAVPEEDEDFPEDVEAAGVTDESVIVPGAGGNDLIDRGTNRPRQQSRGAVGGWSARLSYSLSRPRDTGSQNTASAFGSGTVQQLQGNLRFRPTENWSMTWRTAYDIEQRAFNDHTIRLTRDLHRWEANFDFLRTATGNWAFRFQVSLTDNRDLQFDYEQQDAAGQGQERGVGRNR